MQIILSLKTATNKFLFYETHITCPFMKYYFYNSSCRIVYKPPMYKNYV